ncbi:MAG: hypothetical protein AUJ72_06180 [Candidatus Omnitrophica bacterium CG1_02_46_14]|nr:MAG: hypothetical protein AUJ72_06180 [Candidatus Omnitrophica bacterium CG1_02_46_14]
MSSYIFFLVFVGYFISFVLYFMNFESQKTALYESAKRIALVSLSFHFIILLIIFVRAPHFLIANFSGTIAMAAFLVLAVSFVMESRHKAKFLMLFSLPIVLIFFLLAILLTERRNIVSTADTSSWLWLHLSFILTGFSSLMIAASSALMYLLQASQLKSKRLGKIFVKLPSLDTLDRMHFRSLAWGVVLFSLGALIGILWANKTDELRQVFKDPTVILSFLTCFMYWVVLGFRLSALRRGQKIVLSTVIVFVLLFLTILTSNIAPTGFHRGF